MLYYPASTNNAGNYTVVITNRYGSVTSSPPAILTVTPITGISSGLAVYLNFDSNIAAQGGTTNGGAPVGNVGVPTYTNGIIGSAASFNNDPYASAPPSDWAVSLGDLGWPSFVAMALFGATLVVGLVYVWKKGAIDWSRE